MRRLIIHKLFTNHSPRAATLCCVLFGVGRRTSTTSDQEDARTLFLEGDEEKEEVFAILDLNRENLLAVLGGSADRQTVRSVRFTMTRHNRHEIFYFPPRVLAVELSEFGFRIAANLRLHSSRTSRASPA